MEKSIFTTLEILPIYSRTDLNQLETYLSDNGEMQNSSHLSLFKDGTPQGNRIKHCKMVRSVLTTEKK
ncbi:hypothetical protein RN001_003092 [Aquatica leii]|uniref:Uncharacterized protein n=1 Tax=Aquatica leii TaxID=1421715 RepID=A0AAN7PQP6_9COLE|nr:hypothetical protein RN001_003092 [Aquatica leii]